MRCADYVGRVNFDEYARTAVDLVNARVETLEQVRTFYGAESWQAAEATEKDVVILRRGAKRLREIFEHGTAGRDQEAVTALNTLLEAHPVQPRISYHRGDDWHMHVASRGSSVGAEHMAGRSGAWPLAVRVRQRAQFGVCADERCGSVLPRYVLQLLPPLLLERCATRSHVAAHRAAGRPLSRAGVIGCRDQAGPRGRPAPRPGARANDCNDSSGRPALPAASGRGECPLRRRRIQ